MGRKRERAEIAIKAKDHIPDGVYITLRSPIELILLHSPNNLLCRVLAFSVGIGFNMRFVVNK